MTRGAFNSFRKHVLCSKHIQTLLIPTKPYRIADYTTVYLKLGF